MNMHIDNSALSKSTILNKVKWKTLQCSILNYKNNIKNTNNKWQNPEGSWDQKCNKNIIDGDNKI